MFRRFGKPIVSTLVLGALALYAALSASSHGGAGIVDVEWIAIAFAITQGVATYVVPLAAQYPWGKTAVGAILAGLEVAAVVIVGGLDTQEWFLIGFAVLSALGIAVAPAVSDNGVRARAGIGDAVPYGDRGSLRADHGVALAGVVSVLAIAVVGAMLIAGSAGAADKPRPGTSQTPDFGTPTPVPICDLD